MSRALEAQERFVGYAGEASRFAIYEAGDRLVVRDAETVSDAEVRAGVRPRIVLEVQAADRQAALAFCQEPGRLEP